MLSYYYDAYIAKQKDDIILYDTHAWLTGWYVNQAVNVSLADAFSKNSKVTYPTEPQYGLMLDEEAKEKRRVAELLLQEQRLLAMAKRVAPKQDA